MPCATTIWQIYTISFHAGNIRYFFRGNGKTLISLPLSNSGGHFWCLWLFLLKFPNSSESEYLEKWQLSGWDEIRDLKDGYRADVVVHAFNPSPREGEAGGGQPELYEALLPAHSALCSVGVRLNGWLTCSNVSTTSSTFPETSSSKTYSIFPWWGQKQQHISCQPACFFSAHVPRTERVRARTRPTAVSSLTAFHAPALSLDLLFSFPEGWS